MSQHELRQRITAQIVEALKNGKLPPWRKPWSGSKACGLPQNIESRRRYTGVNPLLLQIAAERHGLRSNLWGTIHQWNKIGGRVKARPAEVPSGQWGATIVFFKPMTKTSIDPDTGDEEESTFGFLRTYHVFNLDQVEGSSLDKYRLPKEPTTSHVVDYMPAERAIAATGADIRFGGDRAAYSLQHDYILCPPKGSFTDTTEYYLTLLHELVHWTERRLDWHRKSEGNSYALAELVAEIGASFLAQELGIPHAENMTNSLAYLDHWLQCMANDPRFIFVASTQASKAADYILNFSRTDHGKTNVESTVAVVC